ncbi:hypothetical protein Q6348_11875 [Isoptericola sp. b441]|uniref:Uncharacterized protein n=1 Tax=Actinotalea lenta TaxID=3064654 RepID=A0ABT9DAG5_9CELL|nr:MULTISPECIES: hypothetical protein [unclassified Isoptericola]MDO8107894.1 hypothetical protein [Isoptericola sp. b441]MDO8120438.1 hypothetical protein [Isoptericola sp. b490]
MVDEDGAPTPVAVVAGGTGVVGRAIVDHLASWGYRVVVPTRSRVTASGGSAGVRLVPGVDWDHPDPLWSVLDEPGWHPTAAVAALGGWWLGPQLVDLAAADWRAVLESHLTSHWLVARAIAPRLGGPDPAYVTLGGAAATEPMAGSGPVSVTGAAQRMLLRVLRVEPIGLRVRFHEVAVGSAVAGDERNLTPERTVEAGEVARVVGAVLTHPGSPAVVEVPGR